MSEVEAGMWADRFKTDGTFPWVTAGSDVEAYFCAADYLAALYNISIETAEGWRSAAAAKVSKAKDTFKEKRKLVNRELHPDGGSPNSDTLWDDAGGQTPATVKGKKLLAQLKGIVKEAGQDDKLLNAYSIPSAVEVAGDLRVLLETCLGPAAAQES